MNNQEYDKAVRDMTPNEIVAFTARLIVSAALGALGGYVLTGIVVCLVVLAFLGIISLPLILAK